MASRLLDQLRAEAPTISVGVLTADLMNLSADLDRLDGTGVRILHFDVMDGCFCPMMTVGPPFIKGVTTNLLKDVHLMIEEPQDKLEAYVAAGADIVTIHVEAGRHPHRALQALAAMTNRNDPERGILRGVALNPGTPVKAIEPLLEQTDVVTLLGINPGWGGQQITGSTRQRLDSLRHLLEAAGNPALIALDGGITRNNVDEIASWGADIVVTGSAVFDGKAPRENAVFMLERVRSHSL